MFELIKGEWARCRKWWVITALLNTAFIGLGIYLDDYEHSGTSVGVAFTLFYGISAFLLGWQQMRTHRSINRWTYLLNRPVHPWQVCLALCAAGGMMLLVSLALPYLLLTLIVDFMGWYVIDARHYWQAAYSLALSCSAYLAACYITLSHNKAALAALVFPILSLLTLFKGGPIMVVSGLGVAWLLLLLFSVFKANPTNPHQSVFQVMTLFLPFQLAALMLLSLTVAMSHQVYLMLTEGAGIQVAWNHYFADNTFDYQRYASEKDQLLGALSAVSEGGYLSRQVEHSEVYSMTKAINAFPGSQQWPFLQEYARITLHDKHHGLNWIYSHDERSFVARNDAVNKGKASPQQLIDSNNQYIGAMTFVQTPVVVGNQVILPQKLHEFDPYLQRLYTRFELPDSESLLSAAINKGRHRLLLSTAALYVFDNQVWQNSIDLQQPLWRLPLPGSYENLSVVVFTELMDRQLVGFLFGQRSQQGQYPAVQYSYQLTGLDQSHQQLGRRPLQQGFSPLYHHRGYYLSPLMHLAYPSLLERWMAPEPPQALLPWCLPELPPAVWTVVISLMLCSVLLTAWLLQHKTISRTARWVHTVLAAVTGLCGVLFWVLFYPRKTSLKTNNKVTKQSGERP